MGHASGPKGSCGLCAVARTISRPRFSFTLSGAGEVGHAKPETLHAGCRQREFLRVMECQ